MAGEVYNLANGTETSILELATTINELTKSPVSIEMLPKRDWDHSGRRFGSTEKARKELGFEVQVKLHDGLRKTVEWTKQNLDLIDSSIRRHLKHMPELLVEERSGS